MVTPDATVRAWVANALVTRAVVEGNEGSLEQAATDFAVIAARFSTDSAPEVRSHAASALFNHGLALAHLGRVDEAVAGFDEVVQRFGADPSPLIQGEVLGAMTNKANLMAESSRVAEAVSAVDALVVRFGGQHRASSVRERVASALATKAAALVVNDREAAMNTLDDLTAWYSRDVDATVRAWVAIARDQHGQALSALGDVEGSIAAFGEVERLFGTDPEMMELVANSLYNWGIALRDAGRLEEAAAVLEGVARRYDGTDELGLRRMVVRSLFNKGIVFAGAGDLTEAQAAFREVTGRFSDDADEQIEDWVVRSHENLQREGPPDFETRWTNVSRKLGEPPPS